MDIFQFTFEKHKNLLLEKLDKDSFVTKEQHSALNRLFVLIRNVLRDIKEYGPKKSFNNYKPIDEDVEVVNDDTVKIHIPKHITSELPRLKNTLLIRVINKTDKKMDGGKGALSIAALEDEKNKVKKFYIRSDVLDEENFEFVECSIQHEIQHITHPSKINGFHTKGDKFSSILKYLGDHGEIMAFAREYAFKYRKHYEKDTEVNLKKLSKLFAKKEHSAKLYIEFENSSKQFLNKHSPSEKEKKEMKNIHSKFVKIINKFIKFDK